ncbi:MAG: SOS-response transcriptional repressor LexA, partial [Alphaproteobacteria bacterium]
RIHSRKSRFFYRMQIHYFEVKIPEIDFLYVWNTDMADLKDRIRSRLHALGKSARRASMDGGLTSDAIRNVLRAKSRNPRRDTLEGIARGLDWALEELLELSSAGNVRTIDRPVHDVPLVSWVKAGDLTETVDPYAVGDAADYIPVTHQRNTLIALRVSGQSMNRVAPDGSIVIVDYADKSLTSGQFYVVKLDGRATFKRFRSDPARLEPDSTEAHETVFIQSETEVVGRVIQVINQLH